MNSKQFTRSVGKWLPGAISLAAASYGAYVAVAWFRYGKTKRANGDDADALLDRFMPTYEVGGRHKIRVAAPPEVTLSAAIETQLESRGPIRAIFKGREWILQSEPDHTVRPKGLLAYTKSLGWGVLADRPGREIVTGCATKPWEPNPVFRALQPDEFATFQEAGYVKIIWTLRADAAGNDESIFRSETRAVATSSDARRKFRRYWAFLSPGIILIRMVMLPCVKRDAERRWRSAAA